MRLHSDILTDNDIRNALADSEVPSHVGFDKFISGGSRTRKHAWDLHLATDTKIAGDKRRHGNPGNGRAPRSDAYAATYDEWGYFIARLFEKDPNAIFGNYKGQDDFDSQTTWKFCLTVI